MSASDRLRLLFDSPIDAGVFLALMLAWTWPMLGGFSPGRGGRGFGTVAWGVNLVLIILLAWTGSRGPILAFACVLFAASALSARRLGRVSGRSALIRVLVPMAVLIMGSVFFGTGARFDGLGAGIDASSLNRLEIYRHSWDLMMMSPISGVGANWGGYHYSQWLEPMRLHYEYTTLLNTYLKVGVEWGVPALLGILIVLVAALLHPFLVERYTADSGNGYLAVASWASLLAFVLCGLTSDPAKSGVLLGLFSVCFLAHFWVCRGYGFRSWMASTALVIVVAACVAVFADRASSLNSVRLSKERVVELLGGGVGEKQRVLALIDINVMGVPYGGMLRAFLSDEIEDSQVLVPLPEFEHRWSAFSGLDTIIAFGASSGVLDDLPLEGVRRICFLDPDEAPPQIELVGVEVCIIRPKLWRSAFAAEWVRFASDCGGTIVVAEISKEMGNVTLRNAFSARNGSER